MLPPSLLLIKMEIVISFVFVLAISLSMFFAGKIFGPKGDAPDKKEPFECGVEPLQKGVPKNFSVHYFRIALLFLIFDLELAFLIPWALVFRENPGFYFLIMIIFQAFIVLALVYAWKKGDLQWER